MSKKKNSRKSAFSFIARFIIGGFVVISVGILTWHLYPQQKIVVGCANSISCGKELSGKIENNASGIFHTKKVPPPQISDVLGISKTVLGATLPPGEKHIYVDLARQMLYAYQGKNIVMQTHISSGKWNPTPTGDFTIWIKLRATRMTGGEGADFYDLPNVPYVMYFYNDEVGKGLGYSLHGAYWHNNFGHPMSHGCVNMRITDAEALYNWTEPATDGETTYATDDDPGTKITISGVAPGQ